MDVPPLQSLLQFGHAREGVEMRNSCRSPKSSVELQFGHAREGVEIFREAARRARQAALQFGHAREGVEIRDARGEEPRGLRASIRPRP